MILPIVAYGDPVLKKKGKEIEKGDKSLSELIENMFETMYNAHGVGLAAPQIGQSLRLFVVDGSPLLEDNEDEKEKDFKKVFINPTILEEEGEEWEFEEGCLSIPSIRENVWRSDVIKIHYFDENWIEHTEEYDDIRARIIQHEYDHIEGVLFTDYLPSLKKRLLKRKLENISKGKVDVAYKMKFRN
ncbi:MAG: peptide deformylase [Cyclobacteriaceae bacterium]